MSLLTLKEACGSASRSSGSYVHQIPKRGRQFDYICGILPAIILSSCYSICLHPILLHCTGIFMHICMPSVYTRIRLPFQGRGKGFTQCECTHAHLMHDKELAQPGYSKMWLRAAWILFGLRKLLVMHRACVCVCVCVCARAQSHTPTHSLACFFFFARNQKYLQIARTVL